MTPTHEPPDTDRHDPTLFGPREAKIMDLCNEALRAGIEGDWVEYDRVWNEIQKLVQDDSGTEPGKGDEK